MVTVKCPETGTILDSAKVNIYAYTRDLYHLPDRGPQFFVKGWRHENPDVTPRVKALMVAAVQQYNEQPATEEE
jgi:hypothetical protein